MVQAISTGTFTTAKWIVSSDATQGTHTTIATALTSSSSGDTIFIRPGTYTENLTLKAGVNLTAFGSDSSSNGTGKVIISGTCTLTTAGSVTIAGIQLQTNSAFLLAVTGTLASVVNLQNCYLNCTNNTGISLTSSNAASAIYISNCYGDIGTTGITLFTFSGAGLLNILNGYFTNTGVATTASTSSSSGAVQILSSYITNVITTSSTSSILCLSSQISGGGLNTTALTCNGTGGNTCTSCVFSGGTASAVSVGAGATLTLDLCQIVSSNTNAVTGAGTLNFSSLVFSGTSNVINTTTQTALYTNLGKYKATGQPSFFAYQATAQTNATGNGAVYVLGSTTDMTEVFDQDSNFDPTSGVFTAPITARYFLKGNVTLNTISAAMTTGIIILTTSNRTIYGTYYNTAATATISTVTGYNGLQGSINTDMDTGDTFTVSVVMYGGVGDTATVYGAADSYTYICGDLLA